MLPDWITAGATVATALAATVAALAAWQTLRRETKSILPVIEPTLGWMHASWGRYIQVSFVVRNLLYETLIVEEIEVISPRGATVSIELQRSADVNARPSGIVPGTSNKVRPDWQVQPFGSETHPSLLPSGFAGQARADVRWDDIYILPPTNWSKGKVKIALLISSRAHTIHKKRVFIERELA